MPTLTIPSPAGTFNVIIKDADGATVYSGTQGNAPFDPGISTPGDYTVYVNYNGNQNAFCFTIPPCECYIPAEVQIIDNGLGMRFAWVDFEIDPETFCPFFMQINFGNTATTTYDYPIGIPSLLSMAEVSPGRYRKVITLTPDAEFFTYRVSNYPYGFNPDYVCAEAVTIFYECISPEAAVGNISIVNDQDTGNYYLRLGFQNHCNDATCESITVNYLQPGPGGDNGSYTFTPDCSDYPGITYNDLLLSPNADLSKSYRITLIGCCGLLLDNTFIPCRGVADIDLATSIVKIGSVYYLRIIAANCGVTCHNLHIIATQTHYPGTPGANDGVTTDITFDCDGVFPQI